MVLVVPEEPVVLVVLVVMDNLLVQPEQSTLISWIEGVHKFVRVVVVTGFHLADQIQEDTVHMVIHVILVLILTAVHMQLVYVNSELVHTLQVVLVDNQDVHLENIPVKRAEVVTPLLLHLEEQEVLEVLEVPVELAELAV